MRGVLPLPSIENHLVWSHFPPVGFTAGKFTITTLVVGENMVHRNCTLASIPKHSGPEVSSADIVERVYKHQHMIPRPDWNTLRALTLQSTVATEVTLLQPAALIANNAIPTKGGQAVDITPPHVLLPVVITTDINNPHPLELLPAPCNSMGLSTSTSATKQGVGTRTRDLMRTRSHLEAKGSFQECTFRVRESDVQRYGPTLVMLTRVTFRIHLFPSIATLKQLFLSLISEESLSALCQKRAHGGKVRNNDTFLSSLRHCDRRFHAPSQRGASRA
jgi:hypothetical protein